MALLNRRVLRPAVLVDVTGLAEQRRVRFFDGVLRIGALCTHAEIGRLAEPELVRSFGVLPRSAGLIAHHPIRTRGTFGGSLAHAQPTSEWCLLAVLLDAEIEVAGPGGRRSVPATELFVGSNRVALAADELITEVVFRHRQPAAALLENTVRKGDYAVALAGAAVTMVGRTLAEVRIAVGRAGIPPVRLPAVEEKLTGLTLDDDLADQVTAVVEQELNSAGSDARYLDIVCATLTGRAVAESIRRAASPTP